MNYISTRGQAPVLSFEAAMLSGLARDGGLYLPETIPRMDAAEIRALHGVSFEEAAFRVMRPYIGDAFSDTEFQDIIARAYAGFGHAARAPLKQLAPGHFLLELFHGPTLAFKDFAMQLIGQMFEASLTRSGPASASSAPPRAIPAARRSRRFAGWRRRMCSSSTRMAACRRCSGGR